MVIDKLYKKMDDCITIYDDDDVQLIKQVVNLEPIVIDLTDSDDTSEDPTEEPRYETTDETSREETSRDETSRDETTSGSTNETTDEPTGEPTNGPPTAGQPPMHPNPPSQQQDQQQHQNNHKQHYNQQQQQQQQQQYRQQQQQDPQPSHQPIPNPPFEQQSQPRESDRPQMGQAFVATNETSLFRQPPTQKHLQSHIQRQEQSKRPHMSDNEEIRDEPPTADKPSKSDFPSNQQQLNVQHPKKPQMSDHELMMAQKALGNEKYKHNLFDDAIRVYKRANELANKLGDKEMSAILHFNLAMTYYKLGSFEQAADECANAVKINDRYMKAHLKRAEIYQRQCKFEEAVICYEHICELDSTNQDYAVLLNYAKEAAKKTKKKDCFQILGLRPNFTLDELKKAYRQQALSHHPDRHSDADVVTRRIEEKQFKDASEAHTFVQLRYGYRR